MMKIPFPLPPVLAHLHERLERYTEHREYGFFLAEQDRNNQAQGQPVLIYITEKQLTSTDTSPARRPPAFMGEVLAPDGESDRLERCAKAGVFEFWRVRTTDDVEVRIYLQPSENGYGEERVFVGDEPVQSAVFDQLELTPRELLQPPPE